MPKNMLSAAHDAYWYGYQSWHPENDRLTLSRESFTAGARWAMRETTRLNPYVSQFIEMLILLGVFDGESQLETGASTSDSAPASERAPGSQNGIGDD